MNQKAFYKEALHFLKRIDKKQDEQLKIQKEILKTKKG